MLFGQFSQLRARVGMGPAPDPVAYLCAREA